MEAWRRDVGAAIAARRTGVIDQVDATRIVIRATDEQDDIQSGVDITGCEVPALEGRLGSTSVR